MDVKPLPAGLACPIARTLGVLGQKWNLLLLREAFLGRTRYAEFQRIGVPTATLGARLEALVEAGLLARRAYRDEGERSRDEYILTDAGRDVMPVLAALIDWGQSHLPPVPGGLTYAMRSDAGRPVHLQFVDDHGTVVPADAVRVTRDRSRDA